MCSINRKERKHTKITLIKQSQSIAINIRKITARDEVVKSEKQIQDSKEQRQYTNYIYTKKFYQIRTEPAYFQEIL